MLVAAKPLASAAAGCLMRSALHLIGVANSPDGLRRVFAEATRGRALAPYKPGPKPAQ